MDGPGFHVDVDRVEEAARGITESTRDQDNFELDDLCGPAEMYGHDGVHEALEEYCDRWSEGLDLLTEDAAAIGDALSQVAAAYRAVDESAAGSLSGDPAMGAADG
jgi:hypothetical protein